jgi:hypothetical protein
VSESDLEVCQLQVCLAQSRDFVPARGQDNAGVALSTLGMQPINGLRHPASPGTTGWYIWCGETFSDAPDFSHALCVDHIVQRLPLVARHLGLPPGYRFLIAVGYEDVWFDERLFNV